MINRVKNYFVPTLGELTREAWNCANRDFIVRREDTGYDTIYLCGMQISLPEDEEKVLNRLHQLKSAYVESYIKTHPHKTI